MAAWDRRSAAQRTKVQSAAVRRQVVDAVGPFSPWWRARLADLGRTPFQVATPAALAAVPAAGERDVCSDGDPAGAAGLVLQTGETGFALHTEGPRLRQALLRRLARPGSYRAIVEAETRPTSFVWAGLGLTFPVASTRGDLDIVARAGSRLWAVLGLGAADVLVAGLDQQETAAVQALRLAALGAGAPALWAGPDAADLSASLRLVPATVLALDAAVAAERLDDLDEAGVALGGIRTLLLVGAPGPDERLAVQDALVRAGIDSTCVALAVHVPDGHRLMWGECRAGGAEAGLHTYPDLELVQGVDPETGEASVDERPRELVVTQLGLRGSALLRWRTADVVDAITGKPCPGCGRTVPRVLGTRRAALVPAVRLRGGSRRVDLRAVASTLVGRPDLSDWRVVVDTSARDGAEEILVHLAPEPGTDQADLAVNVARDLRAGAGMLPTQVVVSEPGELPSGRWGLSERLLVRAGG